MGQLLEQGAYCDFLLVFRTETISSQGRFAGNLPKFTEQTFLRTLVNVCYIREIT